jgi:hypothetical protein
VSDGAGRFLVPVDTGGKVVVGPTAEPDLDVQAVLSLDSFTNLGSGFYVTLNARSMGNLSYVGSFVLRAGSVAVGLSADTANGTVQLVANLPIGIAVNANERLHVRFQAVGAAPTRLRARAWRDADPEPPTWNAEIVDGTPELQRAGQVGMSVYLSSKATTPSVTLTVDDFVARVAAP